MFEPKILLRDGYKTKASLSGMERSGLVAGHSVIVTLEQQIAKLNAEHKKAVDNQSIDFKEMASAKGLDPNLPASYYSLKKRTIELEPQHIQSDHSDELQDSELSNPGADSSEEDSRDAERTDD